MAKVIFKQYAQAVGVHVEGSEEESVENVLEVFEHATQLAEGAPGYMSKAPDAPPVPTNKRVAQRKAIEARRAKKSA